MYLIYNDEEEAKQNLDKVFENMQETGNTEHSKAWDILRQDKNKNWYFIKPTKENCKNFNPEKLMTNVEFDEELELEQEEVIQ